MFPPFFIFYRLIVIINSAPKNGRENIIFSLAFLVEIFKNILLFEIIIEFIFVYARSGIKY